MRQRTMAEMVGRMVPPPPEPVPSMPGSVVVVGRVMERRGVGFAFEDVVVVEACEERGRGDESTGPAIEAYICCSWMCVPGPGRYLSVWPRSCPGRATAGTAIESGWLCKSNRRR